MTYLFLAVLACTLALGGWLIARTEVDLPFHRLSAPRDPGAAENGARAQSPLGARPTSGHPAPAAKPAQLKNPGVGPQK